MNEDARIEQQWNRAFLALAVRKIASERHSGGASKGYAKLNQAYRVLERLGFHEGTGNAEDYEEVRSIAAAFLWAHRREIVRHW
jgi:hypothetical protein